ncbi:TPA: hypothetical protein MG647_24415, partial [Klebsiella pneumoniae]|nr:hypothetical protein [Klebsiella pneumoniae]
KACVLPENPASYRVVRTKSYLFNKANISWFSGAEETHCDTVIICLFSQTLRDKFATVILLNTYRQVLVRYPRFFWGGVGIGLRGAARCIESVLLAKHKGIEDMFL